MKNQSFKICDVSVHPGESLSLALPLPELFSCSPLYMPIKVVNGKQAGPCIVVMAAMHGNELNGTEIINRLMESPSLKKLKGTLIAIPVVNVYGLMTRTRYLPGGKSLDNCFPGVETGTHAARFAKLFLNEVFNKADYAIDLQTGFLNHTNLPQVYATKNDEQSMMLAKAFNPPVISCTEAAPNSLRAYAHKHDIPYIVYEAGEAMRFDGHAIKIGLKGVNNILRKLGALQEKSSSKTKSAKNFVTEGNVWLRASTSGVSHSKIKLGQLVKKGELLTSIKDPFGASETEAITSPYDAIIVGKNNLPLVHEGESLFQLAIFPEMEKAASHLETWKENNKV